MPQITNLPHGVLQSVQRMTPSILRPLVRIRKTPLMGKNMQETSGRATEERSFLEERHVKDVVCTE